MMLQFSEWQGGMGTPLAEGQDGTQPLFVSKEHMTGYSTDGNGGSFIYVGNRRHWVRESPEEIQMKRGEDWESLDRDFRYAMGYPILPNFPEAQ